MNWCIRGSDELSEWQRRDMDNQCNCVFSSKNSFYYTDDPTYKIWNLEESVYQIKELLKTHKEISFKDFMKIYGKVPVKPESDIPLKLLLKKLKIK